MTETKKRARSVNFTLQEKVLLMTIIKDKYKNIVENKKTDSNTWAEKNAAWDEITEEFNAQPLNQTFRSKESLKKCYDNRKKEMRKLAAQNRQECITGGGQQLSDPCLDIIMDITNNKSVFGLSNDADGDATIISHQQDNEETYFTYEVNKKRKAHFDSEDEEAMEEVLFENSYEKPSTSQHSQQTNNVSKQYSEVATLKKQYFEFELSSAKKKQERDEKEFELKIEEFKLRKKSLELDIQLKKLLLQKLQCTAAMDSE